MEGGDDRHRYGRRRSLGVSHGVSKGLDQVFRYARRRAREQTAEAPGVVDDGAKQGIVSAQLNRRDVAEHGHQTSQRLPGGEPVPLAPRRRIEDPSRLVQGAEEDHAIDRRARDRGHVHPGHEGTFALGHDGDR